MAIFPTNPSLFNGRINYQNGDYLESFTKDEWDLMEAAGCIFLPAEGYREGATVTSGYYGYYWSSSTNSTSSAINMNFGNGNDCPRFTPNARHYGRSVRLVRNLN